MVAAGGFGDYAYHSTTEIYDVDSNTWYEGTPLPVALFGAAVVPYKTTFLVIGGGGGIGGGIITTVGHSDKVFLYETSGEWKEMTHMKLSQPKDRVAAMLVPSSLFDLDEEVKI